MAWTDPKTWAFKQILTSTEMNEQLRDNLLHLIGEMPDILNRDSWHVIGASGEPAFAANWSNYGSNYAPARFRKTLDNVVVVQGLVRRPDHTTGTTVLTLPEGYRPPYRMMFGTVGRFSAGTVVARVDVNTNGQIIISFPTNQPVQWLALDCIHFTLD